MKLPKEFTEAFARKLNRGIELLHDIKRCDRRLSKRDLRKLRLRRYAVFNHTQQVLREQLVSVTAEIEEGKKTLASFRKA